MNEWGITMMEEYKNEYDNKAFSYEENEENEQNHLTRYQINSYSVDRALETLVKWKKNNKLIVPEFQREYVWTYNNSCRFIDSILLNLPIPNIFLFKILEQKEEKYILVDGMQRITTIEQFVEGTWKQGTKDRRFKINIKSSNWYNKTFSQLDSIDQQFFYDYPLSVMIFETSSKSEVESKNAIFSVFERINTGSEKLTEQEIRNTIFQGECLTELKKFQKGNTFKKLIENDAPIHKRGKDIEFLLRILTYYSIYLSSINQKNLLIDDNESSRITTSKTVMLNNYLDFANNGLIDYKKSLDDILEALNVIEQIDVSAFYSVKRDKSGIGERIHQIFSEALVIAVIQNDYKININSESFSEDKIKLWKDENEFYSLFSEKTTEPSSVIKRVETMKDFINGNSKWNS